MFASPSTQSSSKSKHFWRLPAFISLVLMVLLLVWDFSGGDMKMAALWGETTGFPLRTNWWMVKVMHEGARTLGWIFLLAMLIGIWRPWGALRSLATAERALLFLSVVCALLSVVLIKGFSHTSCPWDLQDFGGAAPYVSHWDFWQRDGAGGHCFPDFNRFSSRPHNVCTGFGRIQQPVHKVLALERHGACIRFIRAQ